MRLLNRLAAWRAGLVASEPAIVAPPDPRLIGSVERGRALVAGELRFAGSVVAARGRSPWAVEPPSPAFAAEIHGFAWLDDLAALGDSAAAAVARSWTADWLRRFGRGGGPGWTPDLAGRRLRRWLIHARMLTGGRQRDPAEQAAAAAFRRGLARHVAFLRRRGGAATPGLPRFEGLSALMTAGLVLEGHGADSATAALALARAAEATVDAAGAIPSRNPNELLEIFDILTAAATALAAAGRAPAAPHVAAIERIAPVLRALRHADGGLARFHGGGRGAPGRLERALAASGLRAAPAPRLAMGYARLAAGRTSVIVDVAAPPAGAASANAHASTLGFELTSGRRPLIVSCGSGLGFGEEWHRAGRATASHSTLAIEGYSSSRLGPAGRLVDVARERLIEAPDPGRPDAAGGGRGPRVMASHSGYVATHGLTHTRRLELSPDGRTLWGEDALGAVGKADLRRLARMVERSGGEGVHLALHFHLHPDVEAEIDEGGRVAWLALRSGEIWGLRHDGPARLSVEPSFWLEPGAHEPVATRQVVLSAVLIDTTGRVGWSLAKAVDTPLAVRDLAADAEAGAWEGQR